ncbi:MAG: non-heme iron oxygenase ferredoxin subunit [Actinomycetota bacterium]
MKVEVTQLDQLPRDRGVRVTIGEHRIAMFRIEDDVYAIGDRCSHAEASLSEGELFDFDVECPRHGSEFDVRTGEPGALPATEPVPVYEVSVEDGTVYLELEDS